jgi:penicillin-binding protein 2
MQEGLVTPYSPILCSGTYSYRGENGVLYQYDNWTSAYYQWMEMPQALETSCDTYFYDLGVRFYRQPADRGAALQKWSSMFGFGRPTDVDLGGENAGLLPTPAWKRRAFAKDPVERFWKPGDSINLSIGQGYMLATPLQMARFYALLANGGRLVTPHVVQTVERPAPDGEGAAVLRRFTPPAPKPIGLDPTGLAVVREGLYRAANGTEGTSTGVFGSFPVPIAGKTGTAQMWSERHGQELDQAWWCGWGPYDNPELVVCALIENGGHGGSAAAPAARKVFEQFFGVDGGDLAPEQTD